ncbi:accessory Sec system protein Asp1 [Streptococcus catagoni]|uniref:accessory Sec system protein Asp1 n=1 Tax=Streptococcus catagoni TaxID=2654874 RepID=UPI00140BE42A|nr:accessory Sec system protein Asp1 [Streptococcus catagoni]
MYHFIPAWYSSERIWYDDTREWSQGKQSLQFDDTVNQVRVFNENQEETDLLVLNYCPNLRSFLHQKGLLEVSYWSLFDHLQGIKGHQFGRLNWRQFAWPEKSEFIYSPFTVSVFVDDLRYAQVLFADGGYLYKIFLYDQTKGTIKEALIFDDRGFLSSILYYKDGIADHQDYLDQSGQWCLRERLENEGSTKDIRINKEKLPSLQQENYPNWDSLLEEVIAKKLGTFPAEDHLVVASHPQHNCFFQDLEQDVTFSFFQDRFPKSQLNEEQLQLIETAALLVTDNQTNLQMLETLRSKSSQKPNIIQISPFDTRFELGLSVRRKELIIYLFIDNLSDADLDNLLKIIFKKMQENQLISLILGSYQASSPRNQKVAELLEHYSDTYLPKKELAIEELLPAKDHEEEELRAKLAIIKEENDLVILLQICRLIIDLGHEPDLFHQIAAISSGIPQINQVTSDYVSHKENGYIIKDLKEVDEALTYFFQGLSHWNKALIYSIEKIAENTGPALLDKWKSKIEG